MQKHQGSEKRVCSFAALKICCQSKQIAFVERFLVFKMQKGACSFFEPYFDSFVILAGANLNNELITEEALYRQPKIHSLSNLEEELVLVSRKFLCRFLCEVLYYFAKTLFESDAF